ncbi:hypothetical protein SISSUDRAFT_228824 [Sistotremastrum suecicum HHB10207 ss-3]|uniref:Uncharacterized protein n=1 Tax=Sistotremastrum suecicum HHB10207 ss-3 TaxID=1314776 RepID=A0A166A1M9_9AGAM|nr:hypothetical protein SISSUDRAFT_228824 [Sistotremastrum suecicum HHB10207 ss-3]
MSWPTSHTQVTLSDWLESRLTRHPCERISERLSSTRGLENPCGYSVAHRKFPSKVSQKLFAVGTNERPRITRSLSGFHWLYCLLLATTDITDTANHPLYATVICLSLLLAIVSDIVQSDVFPSFYATFCRPSRVAFDVHHVSSMASFRRPTIRLRE